MEAVKSFNAEVGRSNGFASAISIDNSDALDIV